jgi:RNA polymerase sigma factor (sigma-70 family)
MQMTYPAITNRRDFCNFAMSVPNLSEVEERQYLHAYKEKNDMEDGQKIILAHLKLVVKIAMGFRIRHLSERVDYVDLYSEGCLGLYTALQKFDLMRAKVVRFVSFAKHYIKSAIYEFCSRNSAPFSTSCDIASIIDKNDSGIFDRQLECYYNENEGVADDAETQLIDTQQNALLKQLTSEALFKLKPREKYIIEQLFFEETPKTLTTLAGELGCSIERVRQIKVAALGKIKQYLERKNHVQQPI